MSFKNKLPLGSRKLPERPAYTVELTTEEQTTILSFHPFEDQAIEVMEQLAEALERALEDANEPMPEGDFGTKRVMTVCYDNRVSREDQAMYVPPTLDPALWEEVEVEEFRTSRTGEPYYCLYTGFALRGTDEVLYYINPPRRDRVNITYGTPSQYHVVRETR